MLKRALSRQRETELVDTNVYSKLQSHYWKVRTLGCNQKHKSIFAPGKLAGGENICIIAVMLCSPQCAKSLQYCPKTD